MDDGWFEKMPARLLRADFSAGTERFRDELLARYLAVLDTDTRDGAVSPDAGFHVDELDDADLGLIDAAGGGMCDGESPALSTLEGDSW